MPPSKDGYKSANINTPIELHPVHNGHTIRRAFLIEALMNLLTIPLIIHPRTILPYILLSPQINPSTVLFARFCGGIIVGGLTTALFAGLPNTRSAIESRRTVYLTLGLGEVVLLPILVNEAMKGGRDAALSVRAAWAMVSCVLPPLLWRAYVLVGKPELLGLYRDVKVE